MGGAKTFLCPLCRSYCNLLVRLPAAQGVENAVAAEGEDGREDGKRGGGWAGEVTMQSTLTEAVGGKVAGGSNDEKVELDAIEATAEVVSHTVSTAMQHCREAGCTVAEAWLWLGVAPQVLGHFAAVTRDCCHAHMQQPLAAHVDPLVAFGPRRREIIVARSPVDEYAVQEMLRSGAGYEALAQLIALRVGQLLLGFDRTLYEGDTPQAVGYSSPLQPGGHRSPWGAAEGDGWGEAEEAACWALWRKGQGPVEEGAEVTAREQGLKAALGRHVQAGLLDLLQQLALLQDAIGIAPASTKLPPAQPQQCALGVLWGWAGLPALPTMTREVECHLGQLIECHQEQLGQPYVAPALTRLRAPLRELPPSYATLYSQMVSDGADNSTRQPTALCLVCGCLLEAARKVEGIGECTRHALDCGGEGGVIFLVHECTVLLLHGQHSTYFSSPYVDAFGESPKVQQRRRPLSLDARLYNSLQQLWASHQVVGEVSRARDGAERLIRDAYY